jgi:hypothetical protein
MRPTPAAANGIDGTPTKTPESTQESSDTKKSKRSAQNTQRSSAINSETKT